MNDASAKKQIHSGSRVIMASPQSIYQALLDPKAVAAWRPPDGMKAQIYAFDPREGGTFRMSFTYSMVRCAAKHRRTPIFSRSISGTRA
jgi:hypothetical protein